MAAVASPRGASITHAASKRELRRREISRAARLGVERRSTGFAGLVKSRMREGIRSSMECADELLGNY